MLSWLAQGMSEALSCVRNPYRQRTPSQVDRNDVGRAKLPVQASIPQNSPLLVERSPYPEATGLQNRS